MAITSLDGVLAGAQPCWHFFKLISSAPSRLPLSTWGFAGIPSAGTFNTTLNGGTYSSSSAVVAGQIPHFDPSGTLNSYLSRFALANTISNGMVLLCDRLWDNGGISVTSTSSQAIVSPTWPARDANGATAGANVLIAVEVSAACASTTNLTLGYTNSAGTTGRTAVVSNASYNATIAGSFGIFPAQSGDTGVQSVQSIQLTASMTSGTINLVAFHVIAAIDAAGVAAATVPRALDSIKGCFQRIYNGAVPFLVFTASSTSGMNLTGTYTETQG